MTAFLQARNYHRGRVRPVRLIVWHSMEMAEGANTAEACAQMFHTTTRDASAHICVDTNTVVECVKPGDTAWAAPGANADGYQIELNGFAAQSSNAWTDAASDATIKNACAAVAPIMRDFGIPVKWLTDDELRGGKVKGMSTHAQVSRVFKLSTHWDPGPNFPKANVKAELSRLLARSNPSQSTSGAKSLPVLNQGDRGRYVKAVQGKVGASIDGAFGPKTKASVIKFQGKHDLTTDGVVGPKTWKALGVKA